ncbi:MAG: putative transrane signal transduction receptor and sigma-54 dependent response regulator [Nitrospira sp.]|jgi:DNA-binding NtrC family response regulator/CHASE2 domain-containing sensor protein|nr:putative transrane signal transduction receptor and sigma-54 dependent response regulator [Nitrospira sp.]
MRIATRLFVRTVWLQAVLMACVATLCAEFLWSPAPATYMALEGAPYDTWMRFRAQPPRSSHLLLVVRDQASEQQFGAGHWDRSLAARLITTLHDAGAAAVGVDIPLDLPSPPNLGGAVSDALLLEAVKSAATVAYPTLPTSTLEPESGLPLVSSISIARGRSTMQPTLDSDRTVRRAPLYHRSGSSELPAWGFTLATTFWNIPPDQVERRNGQVILRQARSPDGNQSEVTIPLDRKGRLLINFARRQSDSLFPTVTFLELFRLIDKKDTERLSALVSGKVVILLTQPHPQSERTVPSGEDMSDFLIQTQLLHTLISQDWIRNLSPWQRLTVTFALCLCLAWMVLRWPDWRGLLLGVTGLLLYLASAWVLLSSAQWVLPFIIPVTATLIVLVASSLLGHIIAARRVALVERDMLQLQQDLVAVREALVYRETAVETLEEDLESARAGMSHSASKEAASTQLARDLQQKMSDAQAQAAATRRRMEELEQELHHMQAATFSSLPLGNVEQEAIRRECEQLGIITRNPAILAMFRDLKKGARSTVTVLITGEPGTGKELFARAVHRLSPRTAKPFIAVNMAAISPELFESELFGHVRGSFTGALMDRKGYFELAHQGTIFLDEIGDLRLDHQSKLLRVLQDRTFYRVGATSPTTVDVRIVAATNKDLQRGVSEGWFREDLYFRLKGLVLHLPPLRDRSDDIPPLVEASLQEIAQQAHQEGRRLSEEALATLKRQLWKGNIRELRQCLEQAVALSEGPILTPVDLRLQSQPSSATNRIGADPILPDPAGDVAVLNHLRHHRFDMQATAKALGWDRSTVTQRLKGLCFQALVESKGDRAKAVSALAGDPALLRTVELKVMDYVGHLIETIQPFTNVDDALLDCKRRFKNLPERHFKSVEALVRKYFHDRTDGTS